MLSQYFHYLDFEGLMKIAQQNCYAMKGTTVQRNEMLLEFCNHKERLKNGVKFEQFHNSSRYLPDTFAIAFFL